MSEATGDNLDLAPERAQLAIDARVSLIRAKAVIDPGFPGECDYCGKHNPRLVNWACSPCRDKLRLQ